MSDTSPESTRAPERADHDHDPAGADEQAVADATRDIADVPAVEVITTAAVHLMSAAAVKVGLADDPGSQTDLDEARKLINALAGLITAGAPEISDMHARSLRDGLGDPRPHRPGPGREVHGPRLLARLTRLARLTAGSSGTSTSRGARRRCGRAARA